jgi:glucosamine-phosphate N-acetyltransferase
MTSFIRKVELNDLNQVVKILQQVSDFFPNINQLEESWVTYINQDNIYAIVVIGSNQEVLGFGSVIYEKNIRSGIRGHIEDIVVRKDYHGQGIGSKIVKNIISNSKKQGCYKLVLQCEDNNIEFYKKLGFDSFGFNMRILLS